MEITSPPDTHLVTYRYIDIIFPNKTVSYTLIADDWLERQEDSLIIEFADGLKTEVFLQNALAMEVREVSREEPVKEQPATEQKNTQFVINNFSSTRH